MLIRFSTRNYFAVSIILCLKVLPDTVFYNGHLFSDVFFLFHILFVLNFVMKELQMIIFSVKGSRMTADCIINWNLFYLALKCIFLFPFTFLSFCLTGFSKRRAQKSHVDLWKAHATYCLFIRLAQQCILDWKCGFTSKSFSSYWSDHISSSRMIYFL